MFLPVFVPHHFSTLFLNVKQNNEINIKYVLNAEKTEEEIRDRTANQLQKTLEQNRGIFDPLPHDK